MSEMQFHPVSGLFPEMSEAEFDALVADIRANGLREPMHVQEGSIVDGRHRYRACLAAGVEPRFVQVPDDIDLNALVISLNLHRRHLDESQRSTIAARIANMRQGQRTDLQPFANLQKVSLAQAADMLNVSPRSVAHASRLLEDGIPELIAAVDRGEIVVSTAADLSRLPADTQRETLRRSPDEIRVIARDVKTRIQSAGVCGPSAVRIFDRVAQEQGLSGIEQIAVVGVIKAEAPVLPTPSQAKRIAIEGVADLLVLATDGCYHRAPSDPEENARMRRWLDLREGLEGLAKVSFSPEVALSSIPSYQQQHVTAWLASAVPFLNQLNSLWSQHHA